MRSSSWLFSREGVLNQTLLHLMASSQTDTLFIVASKPASISTSSALPQKSQDL